MQGIESANYVVPTGRLRVASKSTSDFTSDPPCWFWRPTASERRFSARRGAPGAQADGCDARAPRERAVGRSTPTRRVATSRRRRRRRRPARAAAWPCAARAAARRPSSLARERPAGAAPRARGAPHHHQRERSGGSRHWRLVTRRRPNGTQAWSRATSVECYAARSIVAARARGPSDPRGGYSKVTDNTPDVLCSPAAPNDVHWTWRKATAACFIRRMVPAAGWSPPPRTPSRPGWLAL